MSSLRVIARKTRMSIATVSRALNDNAGVDPETRKRVLQAAEEVGYRRLAERQLETSTIALVHTSRSGFYEYDALLVRGIIQALDAYRYDLVFCDLHRDKQDSESYSQFFRRKGIKGAILRAFGDSRHVCEQIAEEGFPAVSIGERFECAGVSWIRVNCQQESRQAVQHLLDLGHRRVALVTHVRPTNDHADREAGYRAALTSAGLGVDEELVIRLRVGIESGAAAINRVLASSSPPTALYVTDPPTSIGALNQLHQLGLRVPEDLSIVGFDDGASRLGVWPRLSAVCQDTVHLGYEAAGWLTRRLSGVEQAMLARELPSCFEVNQSTGAPPKEAVRILPDGTRLVAAIP